MPVPDYANISKHTIDAAECKDDLACLECSDTCEVEMIMDRDLALLRCLDEKNCQHKLRYNGGWICNCPVQRAAFSLPH